MGSLPLSVSPLRPCKSFKFHVIVTFIQSCRVLIFIPSIYRAAGLTLGLLSLDPLSLLVKMRTADSDREKKEAASLLPIVRQHVSFQCTINVTIECLSPNDSSFIAPPPGYSALTQLFGERSVAPLSGQDCSKLCCHHSQCYSSIIFWRNHSERCIHRPRKNKNREQAHPTRSVGNVSILSYFFPHRKAARCIAARRRG